MERLTNRDKEIPLPNADNALFWARVHEKLARYEDAEEHTYFASKPQTNADRIRAITDEALAEFGSTLPCCPPGEDLSECCFGKPDPPSKELCKKCWLNWLKAEAKDG